MNHPYPSVFGFQNVPIQAEGPDVASARGHGCVFHAAKGLGAAQLDLQSGEERTIRVDQEAENSCLGGGIYYDTDKI